uniref:Mannose-P-dolichol utilization defect 1a n=1 Tax=Lates calcarifer TaxID=8187 RepID=A0A4W6BU38_LATCA
MATNSFSVNNYNILFFVVYILIQYVAVCPTTFQVLMSMHLSRPHLLCCLPAAQLPQVLKILWRGSAEGLSLSSVLLQLYAFSCPVVYAVAKNFPLFAWAERLFMVAQTAAIVFLILHYRGNTLKGMLFLLAYGGVMFLLGSYAAAAVVSVMEASSLAALIASKVLQAGTNYRNGHTGQLSTLSVLLTWAGSLGVGFVTLQETGSSLATLSHVLSASLSCVLLAQVLCYKSCTTTKKKSE